VLPKIIKDIKFELEEIEALFDLYSEELFELNREPKLVELTAFASVLHSFYTGMEKIFLIISKKVDKSTPYDINWHKTLLSQMAKENEYRDAVISDETRDRLSKYLIFRHFYRHSYSTRLKWEEMEKLVTPIHQVWEKFKSEVSTFLEILESKSPETKTDE
jgi:hypothetical protein